MVTNASRLTHRESLAVAALKNFRNARIVKIETNKRGNNSEKFGAALIFETQKFKKLKKLSKKFKIHWSQSIGVGLGSVRVRKKGQRQRFLRIKCLRENTIHNPDIDAILIEKFKQFSNNGKIKNIKEI